MSYKQEMTPEEAVREVLRTERPRWNAQANISFVVDGADGSVNFARIRAEVDDLAKREKLIYAPAVAAALQAAKERHPHHSFDTRGSEGRILDEAEKLKFDITSAADLGDICEWMISEPDEKVPLSAYGREVQQQQAEAKQIAEHRLKLLTSILQDRKATYPEWSPRHGQVRYVDAHTLESKTNEELAVIERDVSALRRRMGLDRDGQREDLHQFANTNRVGYTDDGTKVVGFENRPKTDSLDAPTVRPYSNEDTQSAISVRTEARHGETDRAVSQANGAKADPFVNPETGRVYSKKEAYGLARNDLKTFRRLLNIDKNRLNRILGN